jgi:hypothetical protein
MLANVGPRGKPMPRPSICLYSLLLKMKKEFKTANSNKVLKRFREKFINESVPSVNIKFRQISIVSPRGMLVKRLSISKEAMK